MDRADPDLSPAECWRLMAQNSVGRVALSVRALPMILPVRYQVAGECLSISLGPDGPPAASVHDAVVALAVDDIDEATGAGWMVQVQGRAALATGSIIQVTPGSVSGMRLTLGTVPTDR